MKIHFNNEVNCYEACEQDINRFGKEVYLDGKRLFSEEDVIKVIRSVFNGTNGDFVQAMHPDFKYQFLGDTVIAEKFEPFCHLQFSRKWWNAPFKESDNG